jgi:serine/threonine-protein kinase
MYATGLGLFTVPAIGGEPKNVKTPPSGQVYVNPSFLPDGKHVLFARNTTTNGGATSDIAILDVETGIVRPVIRGGASPTYVSPGFLVFVAGSTLRGIRFDPNTQAVSGDPIAFTEGVRLNQYGGANYGISAEGTLVYEPGREAQLRTLVWIERDGREETIKAPMRNYYYPRLSPDGRRVAVDVRDQESDIWLWDFARETLSRLTFGPARDSYPVWTPDGRQILFVSARAGSDNIYVQSSDGSGQPQQLSASKDPVLPYSISPDGKRVVVRKLSSSTGTDLAVLRLDIANHPVENIVATAFTELNGKISPDGRWLAYQSNESGQTEVYVRPFPNVGDGRWQISNGGGVTPVWALTTQEIFYAKGDGMMRVPFVTSPTFSAERPEQLFRGIEFNAGGGRSFDVAPDGKRFIAVKDVGRTDDGPALIVTTGWTQQLATATAGLD